MMDVEALLQPVSDEKPSGDALDYDVEFLQLEIAARGRSEQQIGDAVSAGEDPDWASVESLGLGLSGRSKDLRVAVLLARARLQIAGFTGLDEALRLLAGYVSRYWETVHPVPEPDEDATIRISALAALSDPTGLLGEVRRAPLVRSRAGVVSLRDAQIAGRRVAPGADSPEIAQVDIEAAFLSADPGDLTAAVAALASCLDSVGAMATAMAAHDSFGFGDYFDPLQEALRDARAEIASRVTQVEQDDAGAVEAASPVQAPMRVMGSSEIRGRSDIVAMLELISRWYAVNEPASPVPALLDRAKRLVSQDFLALLLELAPAGAEQFRNLAGIRDDAA
jgi:type VI secretion system protein ImpA